MGDDELNEILKSVYSKTLETLKGDDLVEKIAEQLWFEYKNLKKVNVCSPDFLDPVPCPACKGVGWTVLFMYRRDCEFCKGKC